MEQLMSLSRQLKLPFQGLFKDARHFQIIYLGIFLTYGLIYLGWSVDATKYLTIFAVALLTQAFCIVKGKAHISSWKSAMISSLGLCLLFKGNSLGTVALAAFIAIASKFLIRFEGKHLFNPANIGIIATILITQDGWISPGQWGSNAIFIFLFGALGMIVLYKVGRLDTTLTFIITFFLLEYCRTVLYLGWGMDVLLHKFTNGSFLLFAFFMITDPKTTPDHAKARLLWAIMVALVAFVMGHWMYIHTAPIWALVMISPLTVILDKKLHGQRFRWIENEKTNR